MDQFYRLAPKVQELRPDLGPCDEFGAENPNHYVKLDRFVARQVGRSE
jgi:hypothetical protein